MLKSDVYLEEEKHYSRLKSGEIYYRGKQLCKYFSTPAGCRNGSKCTFLHKPLGCVFFRLAAQKCCFGDSGQCPFSHDVNAVVMAGPLHECTNEGCQRSCMHPNSLCLLCFNDNLKKKRNSVRVTFKYNSVYCSPTQVVVKHESFIPPLSL